MVSIAIAAADLVFRTERGDVRSTLPALSTSTVKVNVKSVGRRADAVEIVPCQSVLVTSNHNIALDRRSDVERIFISIGDFFGCDDHELAGTLICLVMQTFDTDYISRLRCRIKRLGDYNIVVFRLIHAIIVVLTQHCYESSTPICTCRIVKQVDFKLRAVTRVCPLYGKSPVRHDREAFFGRYNGQ